MQDVGREMNLEVKQRMRLSERRGQQQTTPFSFYDDNEDDETSGESDEDQDQGDRAKEEEYAKENDDMALGDHLQYPTETEKRRERRHAQAAWEREGDRRRKAGLPRNYLLVDENNGHPYGQGVGNRRKELMLLSRKLDPAIGCINNQPEGLVKEIAEWIQHTWEYSGPMKERYVKDVIARGVSLRRSELWRKIRLQDPKLEDVSNRAWRSLTKELQNPTTIRKSEACSRGNASRLNFGRTGPSGEVGVRERLKKRNKRSPDPEEVQFEMARDRGYGGRSKRHKNSENVMHGRNLAGKATLEERIPNTTAEEG